MESGAYGASLAGGAFDLAAFLKQPQTIVRVLSWVFAIVVFATIIGEGYSNPSGSSSSQCMFNNNDGACNYAVGIGVIAFLACVVFLILDAYFPQISNAKDRKYIVMGDLAFSGLWTFLWFVCFCYLANQWAKTVTVNVVADAARATVAFSFFSTVSWGVLIFFAFGRYRKGVTEFGETYADPAHDHSSPYPPYATTVPQGYQQSPFASGTQTPVEAAYQPPAY